MKKLMNFNLLIFLLCTFTYSRGNLLSTPLTLTIHSSKSKEKMKIGLLLIGHAPENIQLAQQITTNLTCALQQHAGFVVQSFFFPKKPTKNELSTLKKEGIYLVIIINKAIDEGWEWRLYEIDPPLEIVRKKVAVSYSPVQAADIISDMSWEALTGQPGIFCTKIAYCHDTYVNQKIQKKLFLTSPHLINSSCLIEKGKPLAPRWHTSTQDPLLLYSDITNSNICLKSATLSGKTKLVSNFEGLNMLASFSPDGTRMVYCLSKNGTTNLYFYQKNDQAQGTLTQITHEINAHTISPTLLDNNDIIYCADSSGKPLIYYYHAATKSTELITPNGYCSSPSWNDAHKKIAYCKLAGAHMQIFIYNYSTKQHTQITFTPSDKDDCSWSPCGNYLSFTEKTAQDSRIAILNCITQERFFLTPTGQRCSYPAWSPRLNRLAYT